MSIPQYRGIFPRFSVSVGTIDATTERLMTERLTTEQLTTN